MASSTQISPIASEGRYRRACLLFEQLAGNLIFALEQGWEAERNSGDRGEEISGFASVAEPAWGTPRPTQTKIERNGVGLKMRAP